MKLRNNKKNDIMVGEDIGAKLQECMFDKIIEQMDGKIATQNRINQNPKSDVWKTSKRVFSSARFVKPL